MKYCKSTTRRATHSRTALPRSRAYKVSIYYRHCSRTIQPTRQRPRTTPKPRGGDEDLAPRRPPPPQTRASDASSPVALALAASQRPSQVANVRYFRDSAAVALPSKVAPRQHNQALAEGEGVGFAPRPGGLVPDSVEVFHVGDAHDPTNHFHPREPERVLVDKTSWQELREKGRDVGV